MGKDLRGKELGEGIIKVINMEWADQVFLCRKGEP